MGLQILVVCMYSCFRVERLQSCDWVELVVALMFKYLAKLLFCGSAYQHSLYGVNGGAT